MCRINLKNPLSSQQYTRGISSNYVFFYLFLFIFFSIQTKHLTSRQVGPWIRSEGLLWAIESGSIIIKQKMFSRPNLILKMQLFTLYFILENWSCLLNSLNSFHHIRTCKRVSFISNSLSKLY